jgi:NAD-dependent SIR2 family protein deacetylase
MNLQLEFIQRRGQPGYGECSACGHQFTEQEYLDRHTDDENDYCPECCPGCYPECNGNEREELK